MHFNEMLDRLKNLPTESAKLWDGVAIDSRKVKKGDLFVAIPGEKVDGHDFIVEAINKGAVAILAEKPAPEDWDEKLLYWQVPNSVEALGTIAMIWRQRFQTKVVGITGSCGKTSVKGMLGSILSGVAETLVTEGNMNSQYSLPLIILRLNDAHQFAVIEMGASHPGDIAYLAEIAKPNVSLVTNVAPGHLKDMGTLAGVAETKGAIYESLPPDGIAIVNVEEAYYPRFKEMIGQRQTITFGLDKVADVTAKDIHLDPFAVRFQLCYREEALGQMHLPLPGRHMLMNALAASAAAISLGVKPEQIAKGLLAFQGTQRRMQRTQGLNGVCIIDDSYNANPLSMRAAIDVLANCQGEKILVMGMMADLGPESDQYHFEIGAYAREKGINRLLGVGEPIALTVKAFQDAGEQYTDKASLIAALKPYCHEDATILVKGSLSTGMNEVIHQLVASKEPSC